MRTAASGLVGLTLLAAACDFTPAPPPPPGPPKPDPSPPTTPPPGGQLTIRAQAVSIVTPGPRDRRTQGLQLAGGFELAPAGVNDPALDSAGYGGACLIAQLVVPVARSCRTDDQCTVALPKLSANEVEAPKGQGYCLHERQPGAGGVSAGPAPPEGKCWFRPGSQGDFCRITRPTPNVPPLPIGNHAVPLQGTIDPARAYAFARSQNGRRLNPLRWRVLACLNPRDPANPSVDLAACRDKTLGQPLYDAGPVRVINGTAR